jgi:hypothetical protein
MVVAIVAAAQPLWAANAPPATQARPRPMRARMPMPMLQGARDPQLAALVRDIVVLRAINSLGMTRQQIAAVIPELEQVVAADRRLRDEVRKQLLAERQHLLAGTATPQQSRQAMAAIGAARRRYAQELADVKDEMGRILSPEQMHKLNRLASGASAAQPPTGMNAPQPPGVKRAPEAQPLRPGGSPSVQALEQIIALLKEKLQAMPG